MSENFPGGPLFEVLYESPELLVVNKPADLVCHPTKTDQYSSLIGRVRLYLGPDSNPQMINRLDRETSGVTVVAKTPEAARELRRVWERREVEKEYLAIVHEHPPLEEGTIDAPLGKDQSSRVVIKDCVRPDGAPARTDYRVETRFLKAPGDGDHPAPFALLKVTLHSGRKHQIRIHLAYLGHPIVGDKLYGADEDCYLALVERRLTPEQRKSLILPYQALHAAVVRLGFRGQQFQFCAEPEAWFTGFLNIGSS